MSAIDRSATFTASPAEGARPLRVLEWSVYCGPHLFSARPMIRLQIDLGSLEEWPSSRLPCFTDQLLVLLPGLAEHGCCYRAPLGLVRRLRDGTWLGHVIEHVALELQKLAGASVTRGKTRSVKGRPGVYNVLYQYEDEDVGLAAGVHAIRLVAALLPSALGRVENLGVLKRTPDFLATDMARVATDLQERGRATAFGPTTQALINEARRRGIPVTRLNAGSMVQLGTGSRQKRLRASITGDTAQVAVDIAGDKDLTKRLLAQAGLPVPQGGVVRSAEAALTEGKRLGWPVVVKPLDGNHGRGVTLDVRDDTHLRAA